jgi:hypothetical protein
MLNAEEEEKQKNYGYFASHDSRHMQMQDRFRRFDEMQRKAMDNYNKNVIQAQSDKAMG